MAFLNEIMTPRITRAIQKYFQFKGGQAVKTVSGDLVVGINLFWGREARWLEGWNTFLGRNPVAAGGAGNFSVARLRNPAGSNVVAVIERISAFNQAGNDSPTISWNLSGTSDLAGPGGSIVGIDPRGGSTAALPGIPASCTFTGKNNNPTLFGTFAYQLVSSATLAAEFILTDIQELLLLPDTSVDINANVANTGLTVSVQWRERFLEESERFK